MEELVVMEAIVYTAKGEKKYAEKLVNSGELDGLKERKQKR